jgi:hypothetical protein
MRAEGATVARGIQRVWDPRVWGTMVGAIGATVFVLSNRTDLVRPWPAIALLGWAGGLAAYAWFVFVASRHFPAVQPVGRRAGLVYLGSVVAMLALIRVGTIALAIPAAQPTTSGSHSRGRRAALPAVCTSVPYADVYHPRITHGGSGHARTRTRLVLVPDSRSGDRCPGGSGHACRVGCRCGALDATTGIAERPPGTSRETPAVAYRRRTWDTRVWPRGWTC